MQSIVIAGLVIFVVVVVVLSIAKYLFQQGQSKTAGRGKGPSQRSARPVDQENLVQQRTRFNEADFTITVSYGGGLPDGPSAKTVWLGQGEQLDVAGCTITNPLTYTAHPRDKGNRCTDPSQIAPWLKVRKGTDSGELPYWPWYERLRAGQRLEYIKWLASDRKRLPSEDGYLFLYYYGLERRLFYDKVDIPLVVKEVYRLRRMHAEHAGNGRSWSFQHYSSSLLWFVIAQNPQSFGERDIRTIAGSMKSWREDSLLAALSWCVSHNRPCPAWLAQIVAAEMPNTSQSVVLKRVPEEFAKLFAKRYTEAAGDGIRLRVSKRIGKCVYQPASNALDSQVCEIPNVLGIRSQFKPLVDVWNSCVEDLRKLSRVTRGIEDESLTVDAWEALPMELRAGIEHPLTGAFTDVIASLSSDVNPGLVPAQGLARLLGIEDRDRYTSAQSRRIAETAQHIGYAVEPDARMMGRSYKAHDPLSVFVWLYDAHPQPKRYAAAATLMSYGMAVASADGHIADEETHLLSEEIARLFDLNEHELRRLDALQTLLAAKGADPSSIGKTIRDGLAPTHRHAIGKILIAIAAADGVIHPSERRVLRRCYRSLGLEATDLDKTLEELSLPQADDLVSVKAAKRGRRGEAIPTEREEQVVTLDQESIRRIMVETRQVAAILAEAMGEADADESYETNSSVAVAVDQPEWHPTSSGVDASKQPSAPVMSGRFLEFYETLVSRDEWKTAEIDAIAREHGHMLTGAIEAVNDWAYEAYGCAIVFDNGDVIAIERTILVRE
jgi:uncharacterized tellurite resistance protein B-like protein